MAVLVVADHDGVHLRESTLRAVTAAKRITSEMDILVYGQGCRSAAREAAIVSGTRQVLLAESPDLGNDIAEAVSAVVNGIIGRYDAVVVPATSSGKNFAPRVAALAGVSIISDVVEIQNGARYVRPIYAGNALETIETDEIKKVVTVRASAFAPAADTGGSAGIETINPGPALTRVRHLETQNLKSDRPDLASARIVVSGGRALGSREEFDTVIGGLASALGAAIGASRAAVDAGYAPNDAQVGQTGKVVAPELYIAIGISGAIQHLAGMKDSKVVVAINKDPEAPIFQVADYGLVEDYKTAVTSLLDALD